MDPTPCPDSYTPLALMCRGHHAVSAFVQTPLEPTSSFSLLHLFGFLLFGCCTLLAFQPSLLRSPLKLLKTLFPKALYTHPSSVVDYALFAFNKLTYAILFAPLVLFAATIAIGVHSGLTSVFGALSEPLHAGALLVGAFTLFEVLLSDFALYLSHAATHIVRPLWAFHRVHHSAQVLTPFSADRFHILEVLQDALIMECVTGVVAGVGMYLSGGTLEVWHILFVNAIDFLWVFLGSHLRHSHIPLRYPRWLSYIFISPAMHHIHHSDNPDHYDTNFGVIFSFWDALFGTLYIPTKDDTEHLSFGLDANEQPHYSSVFGVLTSPFWFAIRPPKAEKTQVSGTSKRRTHAEQD